MTRYLLDTNVMVRLLLGDRDSISPEATELISDPGNEPLLSAGTTATPSTGPWSDRPSARTRSW